MGVISYTGISLTSRRKDLFVCVDCCISPIIARVHVCSVYVALGRTCRGICVALSLSLSLSLSLNSYRQRSWGPRCKPQTDYEPREEETGDCVLYVRSMPAKRERRMLARLSKPAEVDEGAAEGAELEDLVAEADVVGLGSGRRGAGRRLGLSARIRK